MAFMEAVRQPLFGRIALMGVRGAKMTHAALQLATNLATGMGKRVAVIDTDHYSDRYADRFSFDVSHLEDHSPEGFIKEIREAEKSGRYGALVITSLSHEWQGKPKSVLSLVDQLKKTKRNKFAVWEDVGPRHEAFLDTLLGAGMHVIVTMEARDKNKPKETLAQDGTKKTEIEKIGFKPIQRDNAEQAFELVGIIDKNNSLYIEKSEIPDLGEGQQYPYLGRDVAQIVNKYLTYGVRIDDFKAKQIEAHDDLRRFAAAHNITDERLRRAGGQCPDVRNEDPRLWTIEGCGHIRRYIEGAIAERDKQKVAAAGSGS